MSVEESKFTPDDLANLKEQFDRFDADGNGHITSAELGAVMKAVGENSTPAQLKAMVTDVDTDGNGQIEFREFLSIVGKIRGSMGGAASRSVKSFAGLLDKEAKINKVESKMGATHSFSDEEKWSFTDYVNSMLQGDAELTQLPIDPESEGLFEAVSDGLLFAKLINAAVPDTVDERVLNKGAKMNAWQIQENQTVVINSAKGIGCSTVNIGNEDLISGTPHLVLGLMWQVIRIGLLSKISLKQCPELFRLLGPDEELADLLKLSPEEILVRWVNYHLKEAGNERRISNFGSDIKDAVVYTVLLNQLAPESCDLSGLNDDDVNARAEKVIENAGKIECAKFIRARDIVRGNTKLNLAFVANLFNTIPGLAPLEDISALKDLFDDENASREERAFRMWINSLGVEPECSNLFEDVKDGLLLLKIFDIISPGSVDWRNVNMKPTNKYKKLENANYAVVIGKSLKFSLVGIGGSDIVEGNNKLTLAILWQMMRFYIVSFLSSLSANGDKVSDQVIVDWANSKVATTESELRIESFKDKSLANGRFLIDLCAACSSRAVNREVIAEGDEPADHEANAKYAISLARKIGAAVFCLWDDIVEVKPKMIMTYIGAVMAVYAGGRKKLEE